MGKINSIQYLRAVAVLLVVAFHCSTRLEDNLAPQVIEFLRVGNGGVDLFFVISGFIMWTISAERPPTPGDFFLRRMTRIIPVYWIMTSLWVAIAAVGLAAWVKLQPEHLLKSYLFIPHFSPEYPGRIYPVLVPGWTLVYEMFFYALFALCLFLPKRARLGGLCGALLALVMAGPLLRPTGAVMMTYTHPLLLEFMAGVLIAALWRARKLPTGAAAGGLLLLGLAGFALSPLTGLEEAKGRVIMWGVPAVLVIAGALGSAWMQKKQGLLLAIGNASYSIYLCHIILITFLAKVWSRIPALAHGMTGGLLFFAVGITLACAGGWMVYRFLEQPLEAFFRKLAHVRRAPAAG